MALTKLERRKRIKMRIHKIVRGTHDKPRLSVFRSNRGIYIQMIDDVVGQTMLSVSSRNKEIATKTGITKTEQAKLVGKLTAEKSKEAGITEIVFDRNGYLYHGRVKALAEAAREGGLKF
ncbi:MAG: 50S ribosomal protein L18 [Bacteroidales bacterium]|nr:50S ribosomal protein L18 [Bacteroidales bacterium]